jgi:hypothetical protein
MLVMYEIMEMKKMKKIVTGKNYDTNAVIFLKVRKSNFQKIMKF